MKINDSGNPEKGGSRAEVLQKLHLPGKDSKHVHTSHLAVCTTMMVVRTQLQMQLHPIFEFCVSYLASMLL